MIGLIVYLALTFFFGSVAYEIFVNDPTVTKGQWFPKQVPLWFAVSLVAALWPLILIYFLAVYTAERIK